MPFWDEKPLAEFDAQEWEAVCDGCARCCLKKLQDEETDEVFYTAVVCQYLDQQRCRCTVYPDRHRLVSDCIRFDAGDVDAMTWLPKSCAYRRLAEGRGLAQWHPLIAEPEAIHKAGISVRGRVVSELHVAEEELEDSVITWVEI